LNAAPSPQEKEPGFTSLFNGKDFTGWVYGRARTAPRTSRARGYQIENGVLYSTKDDGGNLYTGKRIRELSSSASSSASRRTPTTASASGRRSKATRPTWAWKIQVLDDGGSHTYTNLLPGQYHGSIYKVVAAKRGFQKPGRGMELLRRSPRTAAGSPSKLNGTVIVDANLDDVKDEAVLKEHRDLTRPEGSRGIANTKGHIGFLGHGAQWSSGTSGSKVL